MNYLLDTHALIWFSEDSAKLPGSVKNLIEIFEDNFFISIASLWEMSIKIKKGTLIINRSFDEIVKMIFTNGFQLLPITYIHTSKLLNLPLIHKDPFDRMLITQSLSDNMIFISNEELFDQYGINRYWKIG